MDFAAYNWVDWTIVGLIVLSTLVGVLRGFVREGLSLVVWILAVWIAFTFADGVAKDWLANHVANPSIRYALAFAGLFVAVLIIGGFINFLIGAAVDKTGLGGTDRLLGLVFGFVRGVLIIAVLILAISLTPAKVESWYTKAKLPPHFSWLVNWIHSLIPEDIKQHLKPEPDSDAIQGNDEDQSSGAKTNPDNKSPSSSSTDDKQNSGKTTAKDVLNTINN